MLVTSLSFTEHLLGVNALCALSSLIFTTTRKGRHFISILQTENYAQRGLVNVQRSFHWQVVKVGFEPRSVQLQILCCLLITTPWLPAFQMKWIAFLIISTALESKQYFLLTYTLLSV